MHHRLASVVLSLLLLSSPLLAAGPDGNVEWSGLSHLSFQDRLPVCPVGGESFELRFRSWADDLTAARVRIDDGAQSWVDAAREGREGPYDRWMAVVPATASDQLSYLIELIDGADVDYLGASGPSDLVPTSDDFVLDFATLAHAPLGATPHPDGGVVFGVWAPTRTTVHVRGAFNGWGTGNPLSKVGERFVGFVPTATVGQPYKFFFNNLVWNTDARGRALDVTDNLNALIVDPWAFDWTADHYTPPPFDEWVIYQLHVGTFSGRNDPYGATAFPAGYLDVAARADHLQQLGVNAVMLNPITEFPGDHSAGYNPQTQWAPEWIYGSPDDLREMVDTLHAHGIAVLLDIVWNHVAISDNFLWNYDGSQIYFDSPAVDTPWGAQADFDDDEVRDYYVESMHLWLGEYRMDGFRMDATDYMNLPQQEAAGWALMQRLNDEVDRRWADRLVLAEQLPDDDWVTRPTSLGGAGFDAQYFDAFTDRLREEIQDAAFGDPEMWKIRDVIHGYGAYLSNGKVVNYLELHDEAWPESGGQRLVKTIDPTAPHDDAWAQGRVKLGEGLVLLSPGIPALLMGSEWLEDTDFGTDSVNRIDWSKRSTYAHHFDWMSHLIAQRRTHPALRAGVPASVHHLDESGNVLAFHRESEGQRIVVVANFSNVDRSDYRIGVPTFSSWQEISNSQDPKYGGDGPVNGVVAVESVAYDGFGQSIRLDLPAMGLLLLRPAQGTPVPEGAGAARTRLQLAPVRPNPAVGASVIAFRLAESGPVRVEILDLRGRRVETLLDGPRPAGPHEIAWSGRGLARGSYFVRVTAAGESQVRKLVLVD